MIKKPKARPAGKTPYASHTIHPNTFLFLHELKGNNNREWLKSRSYRWSGGFSACFSPGYTVDCIPALCPWWLLDVPTSKR